MNFPVYLDQKTFNIVARPVYIFLAVIFISLKVIESKFSYLIPDWTSSPKLTIFLFKIAVLIAFFHVVRHQVSQLTILENGFELKLWVPFFKKQIRTNEITHAIIVDETQIEKLHKKQLFKSQKLSGDLPLKVLVITVQGWKSKISMSAKSFSTILALANSLESQGIKIDKTSLNI